MIKETDDVRIGRFGGRADYFPEPLPVVGGAAPEVALFREVVGREGRGNVWEGNEGASHFDEAEASLAVESP